MKREDVSWSRLGNGVVWMLISIPATLLYGRVVSDVWSWFVVPVVPGAVSIAPAAMGGIVAFVFVVLAIVRWPKKGAEAEKMSPGAIVSGRVTIALLMWGASAIYRAAFL